MHYLTVDHLDHATYHTRKKHKVFSFFRELNVLIIFGVIAFVGVTVFTNAQLFLASIENIFWTTKSVSVEAIKQNMTQNNSISSIIDYQSTKRTRDRWISAKIYFQKLKNSYTSRSRYGRIFGRTSEMIWFYLQYLTADQ
jgi:hypothetical protein